MSDSLEQVGQLKLEPTSDDIEPEVEEVLEDAPQIQERSGTAISAPAAGSRQVKLTLKFDLEWCIFEQVSECGINVRAGPELQGDSDVIRAQILDIGELGNHPPCRSTPPIRCTSGSFSIP